ncbi:MAG TPA: lipoprotein insertase outer membrane protein LolB [Steroidobacteraceae bacterium]|jgi:outer membrane lipoprotein LolB
MTVRRAVAADARPLHLLSYFAASLLLAGCQSVPKPVAPTATPEQVATQWPARRAFLQARTRFTVQGRIGVVAGTDGFNGRLRWIQDGSLTTVSLDGPLGVGGVRIRSDAGVLTLTTPSGEALDSQAAHDELVKRLGFEPPLGSLRYWIQGVPDPSGSGEERPDAQGYLGSLAQDGWSVTFSAYMQTSDGALPQKLTVERGTVRVRLVMQTWHSP